LKELALRAVKDRFAESSNQEAEMEGAKEAVKIMQAKIERSKDRIDSAGKLRSKGFGFVEFQEHAHALAALRQLNNNPTYFGAAKRLMVEFGQQGNREEEGSSREARGEAEAGEGARKTDSCAKERIGPRPEERPEAWCPKACPRTGPEATPKAESEGVTTAEI